MRAQNGPSKDADFYACSGLTTSGNVRLRSPTVQRSHRGVILTSDALRSGRHEASHSFSAPPGLAICSLMNGPSELLKSQAGI